MAKEFAEATNKNEALMKALEENKYPIVVGASKFREPGSRTEGILARNYSLEMA